MQRFQQVSKRVLDRVSQSKTAVIGASLGLATASFADDGAMDLSNVAFDTNDAINVGVLVLTAVAVLWGVRKAVSFGNKG